MHGDGAILRLALMMHILVPAAQLHLDLRPQAQWDMYFCVGGAYAAIVVAGDDEVIPEQSDEGGARGGGGEPLGLLDLDADLLVAVHVECTIKDLTAAAVSAEDR